MEQKLVRISKLAPPPWWVTIAPLLVAAGLIFPPLALVLVYQNDAVVENLKRSGRENDRLAAENASLQGRLQALEWKSAVSMQTLAWREFPAPDRSSTCHACSIRHPFDQRLKAMTFLPAGASAWLRFGTAASWYRLQPLALAGPFRPDGI